jgi:hypothetical protein
VVDIIIKFENLEKILSCEFRKVFKLTNSGIFFKVNVNLSLAGEYSSMQFTLWD